MRCVLIHPTISKNAYICFEQFEFYVLIYLVRLGYHAENPAGNYMVKVNNRNTTTRCEICSQLTTTLVNNYLPSVVSVLVSKNYFYYKKHFSLLRINVTTVSSNKYHRYLTLACCLICISPYFMLFLIFFLLHSET